MKITEHVRKSAAEQAIFEDEGMAEKSKEFVENGREGLREGVSLLRDRKGHNYGR